jgi:hypothetical protein
VSARVPESGPDGFGFMFPYGFKWAKDMTREELLIVIQHLRTNREHQRRAFNEMNGMLEVVG